MGDAPPHAVTMANGGLVRDPRAQKWNVILGGDDCILGHVSHHNLYQKNIMILLMEEILHQLIGSSSHYLQGFIHVRWCRISSTNSSLPVSHKLIFVKEPEFLLMKLYTTTMKPQAPNTFPTETTTTTTTNTTLELEPSLFTINTWFAVAVESGTKIKKKTLHCAKSRSIPKLGVSLMKQVDKGPRPRA